MRTVIGSMRTLRSIFCLFAQEYMLGEAIDEATDWFDHYGGWTLISPGAQPSSIVLDSSHHGIYLNFPSASNIQ